MKFATAVIAAPRPSAASLPASLRSLELNGMSPTVYAEPGTITEGCGCPVIFRPQTVAPVPGGIYPCPSTGKFGNFQNWMQAAADLLQAKPDCDAYLICEDDAILCRGACDFVGSKMWPEARCGAISLYSANVSLLRQKSYPAFMPWQKTGLMGALALVFRKECLEQLVNDTELYNWRGEAVRSDVLANWDRNGVDTWIGQRMRVMRWVCWLFTKSLVNHHVPAGMQDNSALNHGPSVGKRAPLRYVGDDPGDLSKIFAGCRVSKVP